MHATLTKLTSKKKVGSAILLGLLFSAVAHAQGKDAWVDSKPYLVETQKPISPQSIPLVQSLYSAMTKSLINPEQHRKLADIQNRLGNKAQDGRLRSITILKQAPTGELNASAEVKRSVSSYFGREMKGSVVPEGMRKGFNFNLGVKDQPTSAPQQNSVRYGLIVTGLEPHPEPFRLAAMSRSSNDEYALVPYAPKAQVRYSVGPLPVESQSLALSEMVASQPASTDLLARLPDFQFTGKIVSRGAPSANQILPPQVLILEQTQGYYSMEMVTSQLVHKDALLHRFRLPLAGNMSLREERNDKFKKTRSTLENIYSNGPLALNLDYFGNDKRYQTGLIYQKSTTRIEFYNHLPQNFSLQSDLWQMQRWELKLQTAF